MHKIQYNVRCRYCVLSAIAKFIVHLFWEGEGRGEMGEGGGSGGEWGENGEGMEVREMGMHEK